MSDNDTPVDKQRVLDAFKRIVLDDPAVEITSYSYGPIRKKKNGEISLVPEHFNIALRPVQQEAADDDFVMTDRDGVQWVRRTFHDRFVDKLKRKMRQPANS